MKNIKMFNENWEHNAVSKGDRIQLISMGEDPNPIESGMFGTVLTIDDLGQIHVKWDNGRTLAVIPGTDKYKVFKLN